MGLRLLGVLTLLALSNFGLGQGTGMGKEFFELYEQFSKANDSRARSYLDRAVKENYPPAQHALGGFLVLKGKTEAERVRGFNLIKAAGKAGNMKARHTHAILLIHNEYGLPTDPADGEKRLRGLAKGGSSEANLNLGLFYISGQGLTKDEAMGLVHLKRAAGLNNGKAQFMLGNIHAQGVLVPKDTSQAIDYWQQGAKSGSADSSKMLAGAYAQGWPDGGIKTNPTLRNKYLQLAIDQGDLESTAVMGWALVQGDEMSANPKRGLALLTKAADGGVDRALSVLGTLYSEGKLVNKNELLGLWYSTEALSRSTKGRRNASLSRSSRAAVLGRYDHDFKGEIMIPGDPYKPYSLLGVRGSQHGEKLESIKRTKGFKTDIEAKVRIAERAHMMSSPMVWFSPDSARLARFTNSSPAGFSSFLSAFRNKVGSGYQKKLPVAAAAELDYHRLKKNEKTYLTEYTAAKKALSQTHKKVKKYIGIPSNRLVKMTRYRSKGKMTFRNLTPLTLEMELLISHRGSSYRKTYHFTLSPNGSRSLTGLRIGDKYAYESSWGVKNMDGRNELFSRRDANKKNYDNTRTKLQANAHYKELNSKDRLNAGKNRVPVFLSDEVTRPMLRGYEKGQPLVSGNYRAKASCLIGQRSNRELNRYLPSNRLAGDASDKTAIYYGHNYFLQLTPEDANALKLRAERYQALLRKTGDGVVLVNLIPAGPTAKTFDCGCVDYTEEKYLVAMVRPQTQSYEMKLLMSIKDGSNPNFIYADSSKAQSHLTPKFALPWKTQ